MRVKGDINLVVDDWLEILNAWPIVKFEAGVGARMAPTGGSGRILAPRRTSKILLSGWAVYAW